ncbi:Methyltransferase FkbM family [Neorhizobium galegae bv. orientalis]|nr:Methyltransferase FkbM family [Neorhizobium galegae bv. orientalis]
MKLTLKIVIERYFARRNLALIDAKLYEKIFGAAMPKHVATFLNEIPAESIGCAIGLINKSRSQILQDVFVLLHSNFKIGGYFVEFGATNGVDLSNTFLLEKEFKWNGILAEPSRRWHADLAKNRNCNIETDCVWRASNVKLPFRETDAGELSTIASYSDSDGHSLTRQSGLEYPVTTISLADMLRKHGAPKKIDYLSIDTEGSEFDILEAFNFEEFEFGLITCEHNYTPQREKIHKLLTSNGYVRTWENVSRFDDWYVRADNLLIAP